jgi:excisionase family DNA binding protein
VKISTIYQWTHIGYIPHFKLGRFVRFRESDILKWLELKDNKLSSVGQNRPVGVTLKPAILKEGLFVVYLHQEVLHGERTQSGCYTSDYRAIGPRLVLSADSP